MEKIGQVEKGLDATPDAGELFRGIGGNYGSIIQVICELIDNSWANIVANETGNRVILLSVEFESGDLDKLVKISVEDGGTGITNLSTALKVGDKSNQGTTLNEHGFGLVQALSAGNPENDNWTIFTRTTDEYEKGVYRKISAPYQYNVDDNTILCSENNWSGEFSGSGTIISFTCSYEFFLTIHDSLLITQEPFNKCLDYLVEKVNHKYSKKFSKENIKVITKSKSTGRLIPYEETAREIKPSFKKDKKYIKGTEVVDLDGEDILIEYEFGLIANSKYLCNYLANMSTNGIEIRLNGRLFNSNVFKEIWHRENHPSYNMFYGIVNLISEDRSLLPKTKTDKSAIKIGDKKLLALYKWIASFPDLPIKTKTKEEIEKELVNDLIKKLIEEHNVKPSKIKKEFYVFQSLGMPSLIDVYLFNKDKSDIFEAKKSHAKKKHLYQLEEYWDGAVLDGKELNTATLIVSKCDSKMYRLLNMFNSKLDATGCHYNFHIKTWSDFGIDYKEYENQ